jgi:hypothetical protein
MTQQTMLDAFLGTKPPPCISVQGHAPVKKPKSKASKSSGRTRDPSHRKAAVEAYDSRSVHALYTPASRGDDFPAAVPEDDEPSEPGAPQDEFAYLEEEEAAADEKPDEDDSDSCATFDEDASIASETSEASDCSESFEMKKYARPAWVRRAADDVKKIFGNEGRKARASEPAVFSGPSLWVEDDTFID